MVNDVKDGRHRSRVSRGSELLLALAERESQVVLSKRLSEARGQRIDQSQVSDWANGHRKPSVDNANLMNEVLGIPVSTWSEDPRVPTAVEATTKAG